MVFFNYALRKLNAKIVYYGPGLCGKTTNLQWIHDHFEGGQRGKMISLATEGDRTIFFDLLPIDIGTIRGMDVTLQLYTVPGQVHYNSTRQLVLRGADGVVFVADSQRTMRSSNVESFENLQENLMLQGIDLKTFPHVLQFNKRDLRDLLSTEDLNENLNIFSVPIFEAIATEGIGVQETLEGIVKLVMRNLREKYEPVANATAPGPTPMSVEGPAGFQPSSGTPAVAPPMPMAPAADGRGAPPPPAGEAPAGPGAPFAAAPQTPSVDEETQELMGGPDLPAFQGEDEVPTAVYDGDETETSEVPDAMSGSTFDPDAVDFARSDEPTKPDGTEDHAELFTDPRDEDGTFSGAARLPPPTEFVPPETDARPRTDPEIVLESLEPETVRESMDDLFEADEPPAEMPMEVVMPIAEDEEDFAFGSFGESDEASESGTAAGDEPEVDAGAPQQVVAPATNDRYEDRIEAPGPFAPKGPPESPAAAADEQHEIPAEIMQALGASEDREALASLSSDEIPSFEAVDDVQPVVPPFEPEPESAPLVDVEPEPSLSADSESVVEPVVPPPFEPEPEPAPPMGVEPPPSVDSEPVVEPVVPPPFEPEPEPAPPVEAVPEPAEEPEPPPPPFEPEPEPEVEHEPTTEVDPATVGPGVAELDEPVRETLPPFPGDDPLAKSQPIVVGIGDPFADESGDSEPTVLPPAAVVPAGDVDVITGDDNQLHLQLKGSGAIAEMGQVRALDIEVPVPGQWVGNRKVTLQLRLTLTPAEEDNG